jgi:putative ABC transport system substrate-binding protein
MRRRDFIVGLSAATAFPFTARAQQRPKQPTIGFLGSATAAAWRSWVARFTQQLRDLGWIEGSTVAIEYRWAEGRDERYAQFAAEFVRLKVDVIVAPATAAAAAAKQATAVIPIVFVVAGDPVGTGLITSLARPGGNITGLTTLATDLAGKRVEILREVVPALRHLAILVNVGNPASVLEAGQVRAAALTLGIEAAKAEIRTGEDVASAFETLKGQAGALYVVVDPLMATHRTRINTSALAAGLPTMYGNRDYAETGGLMSYGPSFPELFRRAGSHVDKILRGVKPADIPVEQPIRFDLVFNGKTAKALGLTIPVPLLAIADEVIE